MDVFVPNSSGPLAGPFGLAFGNDGNLYVSNQQAHQVLRYNGQTGAFIGVFVAAGSGGLADPADLLFDPSGDLFVFRTFKGQVLRYNGTTGAFMAVVASGVFGNRMTLKTPDCVPTPTRQTFLNGQTLSFNLHLASALPTARSFEIKLWLDVPTVGPVGVINIGADGSVQLSSGLNVTVPFALGSVTAAFPRGLYQVGCRVVHPISGLPLSEVIRPFAIR